MNFPCTGMCICEPEYRLGILERMQRALKISTIGVEVLFMDPSNSRWSGVLISLITRVLNNVKKKIETFVKMSLAKFST